jgi:ABC-type sugar transport system ATPase subunit
VNETLDVILQAQNISKSYPGVQALDHVDFELRRGEIHILLGENGAGKTTLVKILSGAIQPDEGTILFNGDNVHLRSPREAQHLGVATVYQELTLVPALSVAENVFLGNLPIERGVVSWEQLRDQTNQLMRDMGFEINPRVAIRDVGIAARQMAEIAKALARDARVLIMDEPTSALTDAERDLLFEVLRRLQKEGTAILYISHRLEELAEIGTRITVLRDGIKVGTVGANEDSQDDLIRMMLGREWKSTSEKLAPPEDRVMIEVEALSGVTNLHDASFTAHRGEIIGIAGLMGAGRTELARCIFGADPVMAGKIRIEGKEVQINSPRDAIGLGIGYLTENRGEGLVMLMPVAANVTLASPQKVFQHILLDRKLEADLVNEQVEQLDIRLSDIDQQVMCLSGGNQQKVALARWLCSEARILILDDPTRGIDVGAKEEIYKLVTTLAQRGLTVIFISSELRELLRVSHRILVMFGGQIIDDIPQEEASLERILFLATGGNR